jgi:hypothetical protein
MRFLLHQGTGMERSSRALHNNRSDETVARMKYMVGKIGNTLYLLIPDQLIVFILFLHAFFCSFGMYIISNAEHKS